MTNTYSPPDAISFPLADDVRNGKPRRAAHDVRTRASVRVMRTPCQTTLLTFSRWFYVATPGGRHGGGWRPPALRHDECPREQPPPFSQSMPSLHDSHLLAASSFRIPPFIIHSSCDRAVPGRVELLTLLDQKPRRLPLLPGEARLFELNNGRVMLERRTLW